MRFTKQQRAVIEHRHGHARVSAVAGSGKTATLVARVLRLLESGIEPRRILVLMFNVSARQDFAQRLGDAAAGRYQPLPEIRTFHSLGLRITRSCVQRGVLPDYRLVTEEWRLRNAAQAAVSVAMSNESPSKEQVEAFVSFIDRVKADLIEPIELLRTLGLSEQKTHFANAYQLFEKQRQQDRVRYYADLIYEPVLALRRDPMVADWLANHMDHILLDEYQDINEAQQQLVKAIAGSRAQVMAVGDVDQCVYEWRGARPDYIVERFFQDFPKAVRYALNRSFRFGHRLSLLANHAIQHNQRRDDQICLSAPSTPDTQIAHFEETADPHPVLPILARWLEHGGQLSQTAILLRLYSMAVPIELALLHHRIAYRLEGHATLFQCPEIRSLIGHLRLATGTLFNVPDAADLLEAMLTVPQLGFKRQQIRPLAQTMQKSPSQLARRLTDAIDPDIHPFQKKRLEQRLQLWAALPRTSTRKPAWKILAEVVEHSAWNEFFRWANPTRELAEEKIQMCQSFIAFARASGHPAGDFLALIEDLQSHDQGARAETVLMTSIHRAKGLEWPLVILPGLAEGSFPYYQELDEAAPVEDERRLFYVGCTRAQQRLCLLHPRDPRYQAFEAAGYERLPAPSRCIASRFLYEARFALCNAAATALASDAAPNRAFYHPASANRYLAALGSALRIKKKTNEKEGIAKSAQKSS
jgi:DNA helicase-2/ATP-dependent DNA helicase PcrA